MAESGSGAAGPSLDKLLGRLAEFEPVDLPFISLYLNAQANENGRTDFDRFLRKEFSERAKTFAPHSPERESFDRDAERITEYLKDVRPSANGVVVFACAGAGDFFQAAQLDAPIDEHRLFVYNQPHLYPLARLAEQFRRYAVLVADTNRARIFVFGSGSVLDSEEIQNVKTNRSKVGGWSQMRYQRHLENYHLQHAKEVVDTLEQTVREEGIEEVIIAGDEQIVPLLREQMPKALEEKIIDVLSLDIRAQEKEIFAETLEAMREHDAETDAERVRELLDAYRAGGLAVVGSEAVLEALSMGQVDELYLTAQMRDIEGDRDDVAILSDNEVVEPEVASSDPVAAAVEPDSVIVSDELVTRAQQTSAGVRFIEDPALLADYGGVAATLRYRLQPPTTDSAPQPQHA
ncbi:MAG TPA: Vms1/Ankzf1 family peptidyl-tRNA hydrolase [Pyrinomonadaceae bacterium]|nr:Vms1/Ankzf1 family peptidyl-tRNA hydrolase [Pyrinomonadaceae bacterium]